MSVELAKRAVACSGWRWMPGMLTGHERVLFVADRGFGMRVSCGNGGDRWELDLASLLPNLDDPATLGCLAALVDETHGETFAAPSGFSPDGAVTEWSIYPAHGRAPSGGGRIAWGATRAAALVAALEAAPAKAARKPWHEREGSDLDGCRDQVERDDSPRGEEGSYGCD